MLEQCLVDLGQPFQDGCIGGKLLAHLNKCPHHENAHFDRLRAVQNRGGHDRPVLGEGVGQSFGKFEPGKVVAICDHLLLFCRGQLKNKILRKPCRITSYLLIQAFGRHIVNHGEIGIQQNPLVADGEDE